MQEMYLGVNKRRCSDFTLEVYLVNDLSIIEAMAFLAMSNDRSGPLIERSPRLGQARIDPVGIVPMGVTDTVCPYAA